MVVGSRRQEDSNLYFYLAKLLKYELAIIKLILEVGGKGVVEPSRTSQLCRYSQLVL